MNRGIIGVMIVAACLVGCEKKKSNSATSEVSQETMNQSASNQAPTELTLMQEGVMGSSANQTQKGNPASAPMAATNTTSSMEKAGEAVSSKAPTTQEVQQALANAGIYAGKIDGDLGPRTKTAIREFQEKNNLKADGRVGPKTWEKLQTYLNKTAEPTVSGSQD